MKRDRSVRTTFNEVAGIYDEVRPGYPEALFEDIISISGIPPRGKILEIGCGTGQATIPFAERGYSIHCLELGKNMVGIAREKLSKYPDVKIENIAFEDWPPVKDHFDLVISGTAFHWIPSEIGFPKSAEALKDSGYLAIFSNLHPTPYTGFFDRIQEVYQDIVPDWKDPRKGMTSEEKIKLGEKNINHWGYFEKVTVKRYDFTKEFDTGQYLKLLETFSNHRSLEEVVKSRLYEAIASIIDEEYGGRISRPYLSVLYIGKKKI